MCERHDQPASSFEAFVSDPLIRLVMASDGVSVEEMRKVLGNARAAICARELADQKELSLAG